ncbi:MAG: nucleoside transporter C-terminal domain-containing protein [Sphingopyxis sp.]|nr:nucleoside transporter C-terminal domain-containing protein [Sphingopyxis sp.]
MAVLTQFQGLIGVALILLLCWAISENRGERPGWRWIAVALSAQLLLALLIVRVPVVWDAMTLANHVVSAIERATLVGSSYMFGYLGGAPLPFALPEGTQPPLVIAFQILPLIIVFSAISALLWHWGVLRRAIAGIDWALRRALGVSGEVGLTGGATMFLGVVETPLVLRGALSRMSRADLFAAMSLIMATISGALLILYATTLGKVLPDAIGHMIAASLISLPAAILVARLMVPGESSPPASSASDEGELRYESSIDAIVRGTADGMQLFLAVIGVIIVVFALVNLVDQLLAVLPLVEGQPVTLRRAFGWLLAPLMWTLGVSWDQAQAAGALMGTKAILNEYVAYLDLSNVPAEALDGRGLLITTYALCGVANLASVGLLVSTIATLAPQRRAEVAALGVKSWIAGNAASALTGAMVGLVTPV